MLSLQCYLTQTTQTYSLYVFTSKTLGEGGWVFFFILFNNNNRTNLQMKSGVYTE